MCSFARYCSPRSELLPSGVFEKVNNLTINQLSSKTLLTKTKAYEKNFYFSFDRVVPLRRDDDESADVS